MPIPTPSQGQKITDYSAGTVDANSYLIQARNGSTESVLASQIGQFSNLNLLFSQLDTDSKTIVGAINEVNGKEAEDIPYANTESGLTATDVQSAIDEIVDDGFYHAGDTITITSMVLSCYATTQRLDIYVPLPKKIPAEATLTVSGNWRIILTNNSSLASSVILNGAALSTIGTVSITKLAAGISIRVALNSGVIPNWSLGNAFASGANTITIS